MTKNEDLFHELYHHHNVVNTMTDDDSDEIEYVDLNDISDDLFFLIVSLFNMENHDINENQQSIQNVPHD